MQHDAKYDYPWLFLTAVYVLCVQSAMGYDYKEEVKQHASQKGRSPVLTFYYLLHRKTPKQIHHVWENLRCNKAYCDSVVTDYSKGFGGKYGVEKEKVDKAALGYDYKSQTEKHQSQKGEFKLHHLAHSLLKIQFIYLAFGPFFFSSSFY